MHRELNRIRVLWRQHDGGMALWGIPYALRPGQRPMDLWERRLRDGRQPAMTFGWIWLGQPGWWGSMSVESRLHLELFLEKHKDSIPLNPGEWSELNGE